MPIVAVASVRAASVPIDGKTRPSRFFQIIYLLINIIYYVFIVINIINLFRRVEYDVVAILVGLYFLIIGADAFFSLEISYIPIITIILMIPVVILSLKSFYKS